jgi:hypothetical protein
MNMTSRNILPFNYHDDGSSSVENQFKRALLSAENHFGPYSGEVGLILSAMVEYYRSDASKAEMIEQFEQRIKEIVEIYIADQKAP